MSNFKRVKSGTSRLSAPTNSAGWINAVSAAAEYYQGQVAAGKTSGVNQLKNVHPATVLIENKTTLKLERGHVVQLGDDVLDNVDHRNLWYEGNKPSDDLNLEIAVMRTHLAVDQIGEAQLIGVATAIVDVTNTAHTHAKPADDAIVATSANGGPMQILTELTATGEQEVAVLIGVEQTRIVLGETTGAVADTDSTFTIDTLEIIAGTDPRPQPPNSTQTITVNNTFGLALDNAELVRAEQALDGDWEAMRPGGKGDPGTPGISGDGIQFEFLNDFAVNVDEAFCKQLNADGSDATSSIVVAETVADQTARLAMAFGAAAGEVQTDDIVEQLDGADPSTYWDFENIVGTNDDPSDATNWVNVPSDTHCKVLDSLEFIEAYGPYTAADGGDAGTSGSTQRGFVGTGPIIAANYESSGFPGVYIDGVQGLAPMLTVKLSRRIGTTDSWEAVVLDAHGANWCERWPKEEIFGSTGGANFDTANFNTAGSPALAGGANTSYGITVKDGASSLLFEDGSAIASKDELWLVGQTTPHDRFYSLITPIRDAVILKGTATESSNGNTIIMNGLVSLYGPSPLPAGTQTITASYDQVNFRFDNTATLWAIRDTSISPDILLQWRLTNAFDITAQLEGFTGFSTAGNADQVLQNKNGTIKWGEDTDNSIIRRFQLTAGLGLVTYGGAVIHRASAVVVDESGNATGEVIYINDLEDTAFGLGTYTGANGVSERGYRGHCQAYDPVNANEYILLDIEGPASEIVVTLRADIVPAVNDCDFIERFGAYPAGKIPEKIGAGVPCRNVLNFSGKAGQDWFASWDTINFEYQLTGPVHDFHLVSGVSPAVADGAANFQLSNLTAVRGDLPTATTITVTCDPSVVIESGEIVYAAYAKDAHSTDEDKRWDTGDAHNHLYIHRGLGDWVKGDKQHVIHDSGSAALHWVEECEEDVVTDVVIEGTELKKKSHAHDSCDIDETKIADLGPCDP